MRALTRLHSFGVHDLARLSYPSKLYSTFEAQQQSTPNDPDEFRVLDLMKKNVRTVRKKREKMVVQPPRYKKMMPNQDWPSAWPTAKTFHPASVPLPLHQGYVPSHKPVPGKFGNLELMKIPNFLHLTPPAIQRHCEALKKFCTPWPEGLDTEEVIDTNFPLEVTTSDYCHSSPSIRDHRARIITLRFKLSDLNLDEHAQDKFLRLVGNRYNDKTGVVTIVTDCCPLRSQNFDYAMYLVTALYHESFNMESWEDEKVEEDMEKYIWDKSISQNEVSKILTAIYESAATKPGYLSKVERDSLQPDKIGNVEPIRIFSEAVTNLHNKGETSETVDEYGKSVRALFNLPSP